MTYKYSPWKDFYYKNRALIIAILAVSVIYVSCFRSSSSIYRTIFKKQPSRSVKFYASQDCYILDCCLWLHFKIDSTELNKLLEDKFEQKTLRFNQWDHLVPPEAKSWWHTENLGNTALYFEREPERSTQGLYTNAERNEVYVVHYFK